VLASWFELSNRGAKFLRSFVPSTFDTFDSLTLSFELLRNFASFDSFD